MFKKLATTLILAAVFIGLSTLFAFPDQEKVFSLMNEGIALVEKGDLKEAEAKFQEVLKIDPKYPFAHAMLGQIYLQPPLLNAEKSVDHLEKALEYEEYIPLSRAGEKSVFQGLFKAYYMLNRLDEAEKTLKRYIASFPEHPEGYMYLGYFYMDLKPPKVEQGIEAFENCLKYEKSLPMEAGFRKSLLLTLGKAYLANNDPDKARGILEEILKIDCKSAPAFYYLACSYALMNKPEAALSFLESAFDLDGEFVEKSKDEDYLKSLRESPEFDALVEKYGARS